MSLWTDTTGWMHDRLSLRWSWSSICLVPGSSPSGMTSGTSWISSWLACRLSVTSSRGPPLPSFAWSPPLSLHCCFSASLYARCCCTCMYTHDSRLEAPAPQPGVLCATLGLGLMCCAGTGSRFQDGTAVQGGAQPGLITNSNECLGRLHCSSLQRLRAAHDRHLHLRHLSHRLLCKRPARVLRQLCSVTLYALSNGNWRLVVFSGRHRVNVRAACLSFLPPRRVARSQVQLLQSDFCPGPRRLTSRYHELSRSRGRFCRTRGKTTRSSCSFSRPT